MENIKNAFAIKERSNTSWQRSDGGIDSGQVRMTVKTVILVDDILTTGSTLKEAARVLKKNGFEKVWGIVLA